MLIASTFFGFVIGFLPIVSAAYERPKGIVFLDRRVTQAPSLTAATASTTVVASAISTVAPNQFPEPFNITLDGQIFPPSVQLETVNSSSTTDFSISCHDCSIHGDLSLSAGGELTIFDTIEAPPDVTEIPSNFDFEDYWVAATFDSFDAVHELSVDLNASSPNNEIKVPIPLSKTFSKTIGILTLSATLSAEIHGLMNTTNDVNLTYGFNYMLPPGSEVILDLSDLNSSLSLGFNETKLTPTAFNSIRSDLNIDLELSFRPSVSFTVAVDAVVADASVALTVDLDVPKLDVDIMQVHNVTSDCKPATNPTPTDQIYRNLTVVVPSIGFDALAIFNESASFLGAKISGTQPFEQDFPLINLTTACFFYDAAKKALAPATAVKTKVSSAMGCHARPFAVAASLLTMTLVFALM